MKFAFFPGCTMSYRLPFVEKSIRMISSYFNIELVDLPFTCCPEPNSVRSFSQETWLTFAARNIAEAEEKGLDIMAACAGCFETLMLAKHELDSSEDVKTRVNESLAKIGKEYTGSSKVVHLIQVLYDEVGLEKLGDAVTIPLSLKVVTHPGCHLLRPEKILQVDNAEDPRKLDDLVGVLGIESLQYMDKTMCCGAGVRGSNPHIGYAVLRDKMTSMAMVEPDAAVVFCPTCFISFEAGQKIVNRMFETEFNIPVYYYTELLALAMNLPNTEEILAGHRVRGPQSLLDKVSEAKAEITNETVVEN